MTESSFPTSTPIDGSIPGNTAPGASGFGRARASESAFGAVVSLRQRLGTLWQAPEQPCFPAIDAVQAYWEDLRGGRPAPARAEIDPRPLADALNVLFIAERIAPGVARLRLCGQHFSDLLGMEPRGMPLSVLFTAAARDDLARALEQVARGARVALPLRAEKGLGRPGLDGLLALMPLADAQGRITRILGVLETQGQIGRAPRRFALSAPVQPHPNPVPTRGKPALRLVRGGKSG